MLAVKLGEHCSISISSSPTASIFQNSVKSVAKLRPICMATFLKLNYAGPYTASGYIALSFHYAVDITSCMCCSKCSPFICTKS